MKENISVSVRLRPLNDKEIKRNEKETVKFYKNKVLVNQDSQYLSNSKNPFSNKQKDYYFSNCFGPEYNTKQVHQQLTQQIVLQSLRGINSTIFVYGQTGSGKTYTITGEVDYKQNVFHSSQRKMKSKSPLKRLNKSKSRSKSPILKSPTSSKKFQSKKNTNSLPLKRDGIIYLSLQDIFNEIEEAQQEGENFVIKCSYIEIYQEQIFDLLREEFEEEVKLNIYEDTEKNDFIIKDAITEELTSYEEANKIIERGEINRHFAITNFNHNSSRSHTLFRIFIQYFDKEQQMFQSVINFVDLAGSERISKFDDESEMDRNERQKESKFINKSLFFLTHIINMIAKQKSEKFIPYRNSPLTKILKNSLGGNSKTAIILCINSSLYNLEQTLNTLNFGNLASTIQNNIVKNQILTPEENIESIIQNYEQKLRNLENIKTSNNLDEDEKFKQMKNQKDQYVKKYKNLMKLNEIMRFKKERQSVNLYHHNKKMEHLNNVGILDYYSFEKKQQSIFGQNFFQNNRGYIKQMFEQDFIKQKNKKIKDLEKQLKYKDQINQDITNAFYQKEQENDLLKRLLLIFMNRNDEDLNFLNKDQKEQIIQNSLLLLENMKISQINENLNSSKLLYKRNCEQEWSINNLLQNFPQNFNNEKLTMNYSIQPNEFLQQKNSYSEEPRQISPKMVELSSIRKHEPNSFKKSLDFNLFNSIESSNITLQIQEVEKKLCFNDNDQFELKENMSKKITKKYLLND